MSDNKRDIGPSGRAVADTVERLRVQSNLTFDALSKALTAQGRTIPPLGLRRIRDYTRRVDVDDLVALAAVLNTTPQALMDTSAAEDYRSRCLRWLMAEDDYRHGRTPPKPSTLFPMQPGVLINGGVA
jgi:hypothetical protein